MKKELTKPGGLFLVTNPNGTLNGTKINRYGRSNNKLCSRFFSRNVYNYANKR